MSLPAPALAEVRFGNNVRIGGHDFSNRTYRTVRIERITTRPPWQGCRILNKGARFEGRRLTSRTEICYLKSIPPHKRKPVR
ncbi:MAG: hypothetical protein WBA44_15325 [Mesorhizobium sp.]